MFDYKELFSKAFLSWNISVNCTDTSKTSFLGVKYGWKIQDVIWSRQMESFFKKLISRQSSFYVINVVLEGKLVKKIWERIVLPTRKSK